MLTILHSYWAYLVLTILVIVTFNAIIGFLQKKEYTHKDFRLGLFGMIVTHMQLLIGLIVYIAGQWYSGFSQMKNSGIRLLALEHPLMMIIAIALITIGWSKHKKKVKSESKFKTISICYGLGLIVILSRIPWSNWIS